MQLEIPPTNASELTSLVAMDYMRFAKDLVESEVEDLRHLHTGDTAESKDTLSERTKNQCFDEQSWDSLKSIPFYDVLLEHKDVIPEEIPQDKGIQHEIDLVRRAK
ncbi:hypothetical protein PInf_026584 [Phytophthora infestans]|nr:hypothetical protein PInf_026584 [Phytophthora infestans]